MLGVPPDRWGETVKALVVRRPDVEITPEDLIAFAKDRIASYKCPTSVEWVEALPRNPSGKILKRELRARYWQDSARNVG